MGWHIKTGPNPGHWGMQVMGAVFAPEAQVAIGLYKDKVPQAAVIYENWNGRSIVAHMVITGRITRRYLFVIFDYAFRNVGAEKVILPVQSTNIKSIKFVTHLGFAEETRVIDAAPGGDIILYTMKKAACRFLGEKYGQTVTASRA